ncbi:Wzt carbohydrate-binding domain-containing protein, partial [Echinicola sediminis]
VTWSGFINQEIYGKSEKGISGSPYHFKLYFESSSDIDKTILSIGFFSKNNNTFFFSLRTDCINYHINTVSGEKKSVTFLLSKLPLRNGVYSINLMAQTKYETLDWIKDAGEISVIDGDYYGSGIIPAQGREGVLVDFEII